MKLGLKVLELVMKLVCPKLTISVGIAINLQIVFKKIEDCVIGVLIIAGAQ